MSLHQLQSQLRQKIGKSIPDETPSNKQSINLNAIRQFYQENRSPANFMNLKESTVRQSTISSTGQLCSDREPLSDEVKIYSQLNNIENINKGHGQKSISTIPPQLKQSYVVSKIGGNQKDREQDLTVSGKKSENIESVQSYTLNSNHSQEKKGFNLEYAEKINIDQQLIQNQQQLESLDNDVNRLRIENVKLQKQLSEAQKKLTAIGKNENNTSSQFSLPSEFKSNWENMAKDQIVNCFIDFIDYPNFLVEIVQEFIHVVFSQVRLSIANKNKEVIKVLGVQEIKPEEIGKYLIQVYQNHNEGIFKFNDEIFDKIVCSYKSIFKALADTYNYKYEIMLKEESENISIPNKEIANLVHTPTIFKLEDTQQYFENMIEGEDFHNFAKSVFELCIFMQLNEPTLTIQVAKRNGFKYYKFRKSDYICIDGFAKDDSICLEVLPSVMRSNYPFNGIKPSVLILQADQINQQILSIAEEYEKEQDLKKSRSPMKLLEISQTNMTENNSTDQKLQLTHSNYEDTKVTPFQVKAVEVENQATTSRSDSFLMKQQNQNKNESQQQKNQQQLHLQQHENSCSNLQGKIENDDTMSLSLIQVEGVKNIENPNFQFTLSKGNNWLEQSLERKIISEINAENSEKQLIEEIAEKTIEQSPRVSSLNTQVDQDDLVSENKQEDAEGGIQNCGISSNSSSSRKSSLSSVESQNELSKKEIIEAIKQKMALQKKNVESKSREISPSFSQINNQESTFQAQQGWKKRFSDQLHSPKSSSQATITTSSPIPTSQRNKLIISPSTDITKDNQLKEQNLNVQYQPYKNDRTSRSMSEYNVNNLKVNQYEGSSTLNQPNIKSQVSENDQYKFKISPRMPEDIKMKQSLISSNHYYKDEDFNIKPQNLRSSCEGSGFIRSKENIEKCYRSRIVFGKIKNQSKLLNYNVSGRANSLSSKIFSPTRLRESSIDRLSLNMNITPQRINRRGTERFSPSKDESLNPSFNESSIKYKPLVQQRFKQDQSQTQRFLGESQYKDESVDSMLHLYNNRFNGGNTVSARGSLQCSGFQKLEESERYFDFQNTENKRIIDSVKGIYQNIQQNL